MPKTGSIFQFPKIFIIPDHYKFTEGERYDIQQLYRSVMRGDLSRDRIIQLTNLKDQRNAELQQARKKRDEKQRDTDIRIVSYANTQYDGAKADLALYKKAARRSSTAALKNAVKIISALKATEGYAKSTLKKKAPELPVFEDITPIHRRNFYRAISQVDQNLKKLIIETPEDPVTKFKINPTWDNISPQRRMEILRRALSPLTLLLDSHNEYAVLAFAPHGRRSESFDWAPQTKYPYPQINRQGHSKN